MSENDAPKPSPKLWPSTEPPFKGYRAAPSEGYKQSSSETAIVIDNGQCTPQRRVSDHGVDL